MEEDYIICNFCSLNIEWVFWEFFWAVELLNECCVWDWANEMSKKIQVQDEKSFRVWYGSTTDAFTSDPLTTFYLFLLQLVNNLE